MSRLFAVVFLLFMGGSGLASLVAGTAWPLICAVTALYFLIKVFSACDQSVPPAPEQKFTYHNGNSNRRMPT